MKKIAFATHVALIDGKEYEYIGDLLVEALEGTGLEYSMLRHSIDGRLPSEILTYGKTGLTTKKRLGVIGNPAPLRYISEFLATVMYFTFRNKTDVFVGIDPLNAAAGAFLKKIGRVDYCVFYNSDYSTKRFDNGLLNKTYHMIDRYAVRNANEVWCVSARIREVRSKMGLPDAKNLLIPNVPPAKFDYLRANKHDKFALVSSGIIDTQLDNEGVIRALHKVLPRYPKLTFTIVGNGPDEQRLRDVAKQLKVEDKVIFKGRQPLGTTFEIYSHCGIGLALYTGEWGFNYYGDSTKSRQCFYLGIPVISTDSHATVQEIKDTKAGVITEKGVDAYVSAIEEILENYDEYSKASRALGDRYKDIHQKQVLGLVKP